MVNYGWRRDDPNRQAHARVHAGLKPHATNYGSEGPLEATNLGPFSHGRHVTAFGFR